MIQISDGQNTITINPETFWQDQLNQLGFQKCSEFYNLLLETFFSVLPKIVKKDLSQDSFSSFELCSFVDLSGNIQMQITTTNSKLSFLVFNYLNDIGEQYCGSFCSLERSLSYCEEKLRHLGYQIIESTEKQS